MREGQVVELIRSQMFALQGWCNHRISEQKSTMAGTHTLAANAHLRLHALIDCLIDRPRYKLWGVRLPVKRALTAMEIEVRYQVLRDKLVAQIRARDGAPTATSLANELERVAS